MELRCWGAAWGLPTAHADALVVLAYAKFSGANLTVSPIDWTWRTLTVTTPELVCGDCTVTEPSDILNFLRKQLHTFWVDAENYANLMRPWSASRSPFPLNFLVPSRHANKALARILLSKVESPYYSITEVEGK
ncbi:hypothetical protein CRUP_034220, partial [Coryphaenoides rupestris]